MLAPHLVAPTLALLGSSLAGAEPPATQPERTAAPMDVRGELDSTWAYLARKYDADRDGRILRTEYRRDGDGFARLDRDGDGVISAADFEQRGRDRGREGRVARILLMMYFQDDDDAAALSRGELERAVDAYDTSRDGRIDEGEFTCAYEARGADVDPALRRMLGELEPWPTLVGGLDADGDGAIAKRELVAYFTERDDGDGVWRMPGDAPRSRRGRGGGGERAMSGPAEGTLAPDFTLVPPDGGEPVQLSGFKGQRPVALIFGSYT